VQNGNLIELTSYEEALPKDTDLTFTVVLSNPSISPMAVDNIWRFEALSRANSDNFYMVSTHQYVSGFKVFGEFSVASILPDVLSPTAENRVSLTFMLKSPLVYTSSSLLWVWLPPGWEPYDYVPPGSTTENWWTELADPQLLSGTTASKVQHESGQYYVEFRLGRTADSGIEYKFAFDTKNPQKTPAEDLNMWRLETSQNDVMLHLQNDIAGFGLQELVNAEVTPERTTTKLAHNKVSFDFESNQQIPGGSLITIMAPEGYIFDCYDTLALFETKGLASTTTCSDFPLIPNKAELTLDSLDEVAPNSPFTIIISMTNPIFAPQQNWFTFSIVDASGAFVDVANNVSAYDITGSIKPVTIEGTNSYYGYKNPLIVQFKQDTIMNMQEEGNEIVLTGPNGFVFPVNCTGFDLQFSTTTDTQDVAGYGDKFIFPPPGIQCVGFGNSTVVIRLPPGAGLLTNMYTLLIDVQDPLVGELNGTADELFWSLMTRVNSNATNTYRIVDSNTTVPGFEVIVLQPMEIDEGGARPLTEPCYIVLLALGAVALFPALGPHAAGP